MSSLMQDKTFISIAVLLLIVLGINIGIEVYPMLAESGRIEACTSGIIKERVERLESTQEDGVKQIMKYYKIECNDGSMREVKAFKSFPLETRIGKEWVRQ